MGAYKVFLKLANHLVTGAIVAALLAVIVLFMGPRLLGWQLVVVLSGSMEPTLPVGAVAFVEPASPTAVNEGDILTFRLPDEARDPGQAKTVQVTHRVIEVVRQGQNLGFRTQGDANESPDEYIVPAANVVGVVHWQVPHVGFLADRLRTREGFLLLIGIPGMLIVAGELRTILREIQAMRSRRRVAGETE